MKIYHFSLRGLRAALANSACMVLLTLLCACGGESNNKSSAGSNASSESSEVDSSSSASSSLSVSSSFLSSSSAANVITTVIEEQQQAFCPFNGLVESEHNGFTGAGYANAANAQGAQLTWALQILSAGSYKITLRYAHTDMAGRAGRLAFAGNSPGNNMPTDKSADLAFVSTGAWAAWQEQSVTMDLPAGATIATLTALVPNGLPNIDSLSLEGPDQVVAGLCPEQSPVTVWLAGDSTVANGNTPCPVGWGKVFAEQFNNKVTVQNSAAGGRSVRTWLYDVQNQMEANGECLINRNGDGSPVLQTRWSNMLDQMRSGDYLFIQFGINDGSPTCPRHVGTGAFQQSFAYMVEQAQARGVNPVLVTPAPAIRCSGSTAVASRGFLSETFAVAQQFNLPVIDLHQLGTDLYNQLAFCPVAGGDVSASTGGEVGAFFCDDHTHFDTPGARQIAKLIADQLRAQAVPLTDYLKED